MLNEWEITFLFCVGIGLSIAVFICCLTGFCFYCIAKRTAKNVEEEKIQAKDDAAQYHKTTDHICAWENQQNDNLNSTTDKQASKSVNEVHNYVNPVLMNKRQTTEGESEQINGKNGFPGAIATKNITYKEHAVSFPATICLNLECKRRYVHHFVLTESGQSFKLELQSENSALAVPRFICVEFPKCCVLGTRRIKLEIFVPSTSETTELQNCWVLASAVVNICQSENVPFLRKVKVQIPLIQTIEDSFVIQNQDRGKTVTIEPGVVTIESFKFSPAGLAYKTSQITQFLRPLDHFDEDLLFNDGTIYFTMKQHVVRSVTGDYQMEFNCRPFEDPMDQEQHRSKENWSYYPIKMDSSIGSKIKMSIKSKQAPVSFEDFDIPIEFDIITNSVETTSTEQKQSWTVRTNKTTKEYKFTSEIFDDQYLSFKVGQNQLVNFPVLSESDLLSLNSHKILSSRILQEFLTLLEDKVFLFLVSALGVGKEYLFDFLRHDLVETILEFLDTQTVNLTTRARDQCLLDHESSLFRQCPELRNFIDNLKEADSKFRILRICSEKFEQIFFHRAGDTAKAEVLRLLGINCESSSLLGENVRSLSRILIYMDNKELLKHMQNAFENGHQYRLKQRISKMSDDMQKLFVTPEGADDLEIPGTILDGEVVEIEFEPTIVEQNELLPCWLNIAKESCPEEMQK